MRRLYGFPGMVTHHELAVGSDPGLRFGTSVGANNSHPKDGSFTTKSDKNSPAILRSSNFSQGRF